MSNREINTNPEALTSNDPSQHSEVMDYQISLVQTSFVAGADMGTLMGLYEDGLLAMRQQSNNLSAEERAVMETGYNNSVAQLLSDAGADVSPEESQDFLAQYAEDLQKEANNFEDMNDVAYGILKEMIEENGPPQISDDPDFVDVEFMTELHDRIQSELDSFHASVDTYEAASGEVFALPSHLQDNNAIVTPQDMSVQVAMDRYKELEEQRGLVAEHGITEMDIFNAPDQNAITPKTIEPSPTNVPGLTNG